MNVGNKIANNIAPCACVCVCILWAMLYEYLFTGLMLYAWMCKMSHKKHDNFSIIHAITLYKSIWCLHLFLKWIFNVSFRVCSQMKQTRSFQCHVWNGRHKICAPGKRANIINVHLVTNWINEQNLVQLRIKIEQIRLAHHFSFGNFIAFSPIHSRILLIV